MLWPSASFGIEFAGDCPRSLARFDRALHQWGRHLLGWPSGTPNASVLCELGLHDGLRVSSGRALALYARRASFALGSRPPVPASVFTLAQSTSGSWAHWCRAMISHHSVQRPDLYGVGPRLLCERHSTMGAPLCDASPGSLLATACGALSRPPPHHSM